MKKNIDAPYLDGQNQSTPVEKIVLLLDQLPQQAIAYMPWKEFTSGAKVTFAIAHGKDSIFLKFFVEEEILRSTYIHSNDPVFKDSCVEFFIGFNGEPDYYNFEFNCAGTCLAGFGKGRARLLLPKGVIQKIRHHTIIKKANDKNLIRWELTLIIPVVVFIHHQFTTLVRLEGRTNFFKCGDDLPNPHYLAWNDIKSAEPNFHLPEFFGALSFGT